MLRKMFYFVRKYILLFLLMAFLGLSINVSTITIADKIIFNSLTFRPATDKDLFCSLEMCFYMALVIFVAMTFVVVLFRIFNKLSCGRFISTYYYENSCYGIESNNLKVKKDVCVQLRI